MIPPSLHANEGYWPRKGHSTESIRTTYLMCMTQMELLVCILTVYLLPIGSEEHEVLQTGSIHVTILPSCQSFIIML